MNGEPSGGPDTDANCSVVEEQFDVVVVGAGGAGLAAASMAASLGRSVVLLEKNAALGGSTSWSVGSVSATSTPHQFQAGILDCPQDHWEDMQKFAGHFAARDNPHLGRVLAEGTPEMFRWLISAGLEFIGPMPEPPHRRARMHNVLPNSRAFATRLGNLCRRQGVRIVTEACAQQILFENNRATIVQATTPRGIRRWRAAGGIILAGGDYSASPGLKKRYASAEAAQADPVNPTSTGEGIQLGLDCGGEVLNGDYVRGPFLRFIPPPKEGWLTKLPPWRIVTRTMRWAHDHLPSFLLRPLMMKFLTTTLAPDAGLFKAGAALIDRDGSYLGGTPFNPHLAAARAPEGLGYIIFNQRIANLFSAWPHFISTAPGIAYAYLADYQRTRGDICFAAPTIEQLALKLKIDSQRLSESIEQHNRQLENSSETQSLSIGNGPYFALGPAKAYVVFTNGGLRVSETLEVLRPDGSAIKGLYAAGSNGQGGQLLEGHGHHLGRAFVSGRIAGRQAALQSTTET